jgi:hypothetical protein
LPDRWRGEAAIHIALSFENTASPSIGGRGRNEFLLILFSEVSMLADLFLHFTQDKMG